ncbi:MAG: sigma-70 family RNA polymerase sigma factor [Planctomycetota bacterium]
MSRPLHPDPAASARELGDLLAEAGWVRDLARRLARDQAAADDVAQATLALALERRPTAGKGLRPWLAQVAGRLAARQRIADARRARRESRSVELSRRSAPTSDELLERLEQQQRIADAVRALPEPYRSVILRRHYEGQSTAEIARATGASAATVRSQLARGLERLRLALEPDAPDAPGSRMSALGALLLASGSDTGLLSRGTAQLIAMKTTSKLAACAALAAIALVVTAGPALLKRDALHPNDGGGALVDAPLTEVDAGLVSVIDAPNDTAARVGAPADAAPTALVAQAKPSAAAQDVSTVMARLVDERGAPVVGAELRSIYVDGRPRGPHTAALSDEDGRAVLEIPDEFMRARAPKVYSMVFAASGPGRATTFVKSTPAWHGETDLGAVALAPGGGLSGTVVDELGAAVAGARLMADPTLPTSDIEGLRVAGPDPGVTRPRADSTPGGGFLLAGVELGTVRLWAHAPGYLWTISEPIELTSTGTRDVGPIVLQRPAREQLLRGTVLRPDGAPARDAEVAFDSMAMALEGTVVTDERGGFEILPTGAGIIELIARDPTGAFGMSPTVRASAGDQIELRLMPARVIDLRVVDPAGAPIEGAALMPVLSEGFAVFADGGRPVPGEDWTRTDAEGRARLFVPGEAFEVTVSRKGYLGQRRGPYLPETAPATLEIALELEPRVEGRVVAHGAPVEGARITIGQRSEGFVPRQSGFAMRFFTNQDHGIVTGRDGTFACPVDADWTDIAVLAICPQHASGEVELTVLAGKGATGVVIEVVHGGAVSGLVLPPPGRGPEGLIVAASRGDGHPVWTRADAEGRYRLSGLAPGPWRVEGRQAEPNDDTLSIAQRPEVQAFNWNVQVFDGVDTRFDVDMRQQGDVEVQGRFLVDGEAPQEPWTVELVPAFEEVQRDATVAAALNAEGGFTLTVPSGQRELCFRATLAGGARVEVIREANFVGPRLDWEGGLTTKRIEEKIDGPHEQVRLVRAKDSSKGDREVTRIPVGAGGVVSARVPVGPSSLQVPMKSALFSDAWEVLRMLQ